MIMLYIIAERAKARGRILEGVTEGCRCYDRLRANGGIGRRLSRTKWGGERWRGEREAGCLGVGRVYARAREEIGQPSTLRFQKVDAKRGGLGDEEYNFALARNRKQRGGIGTSDKSGSGGACGYPEARTKLTVRL